MRKSHRLQDRRSDRRNLLRALEPSSQVYGQIRRLAELGAIDARSLKLVDQTYLEVAEARFRIAKARLSEARALVDVSPRAVHGATYYAMYHAARAALLATYKEDIDDKGKVEDRIGELLKGRFGEVLVEQRRRRNQAEYDPLSNLDDPKDDPLRCLRVAQKFVSVCSKQMRR